MSPAAALRAVKVAHTAAWALFASSVLALPYFAWRQQLAVAFALIAVVSVEVLVLLADRVRCPLTDVAARYTADRRNNFDIYLPLRLARRNKQTFGPLFAAGVLCAFVRWLT